MHFRLTLDAGLAEALDTGYIGEHRWAGVLLRDAITYEPPGGLLGFVLTPALVGQQLAGVFAHREAVLPGLLAVGT